MQIDSHPFYILRTPSLPYQPLSAEKVVPFLQKTLTNPVVKEAIFLASPDLTKKLTQWQEGRIHDQQEEKQVVLSLYKYLLRMQYRCTPFGLFAGITLGDFADITKITPNLLEENQPFTRPDMDYLCHLAWNIAKSDEAKQTLYYSPNNTLYSSGDKLRYVEYRLNKKMRSHHLVNIENSEYVQRVLHKAAKGAKTQELAAVLIDDEITPEDALEFVYEMIDSQVLLSELEPVITGQEYLDFLLEKLRSHSSLQHYYTFLLHFSEKITHLDQSKSEDRFHQYATIISHAQQAQVEFNPKHLLQVDTYRPFQNNQLSRSLLKEIESVIRLLYQTSNYRENQNLKTFKERFYTRYEDRSVPLLEVLDVEMGIGYPAQDYSKADNSPLLQNIAVWGQENSSPQYSLDNWQQFLLKKYYQAASQQGSFEICLQEDEITELFSTNKKEIKLPNSMHAFISLLAATQEELNAGNYQLLFQYAGGPSSANLLGRFAHLHPELRSLLYEALQEETQENPEAIYAEIVHINQARIGNISKRPILRDYEIPILIQSGVDEEHTILLKDLQLSLVQDQLILVDKKRQKQVIPRLSSAHNYALQALPVYHFLCDLQFQNTQGSVSWNWGILGNMPHLPRVTFGKTILSRERWVLKGKDIQPQKHTPEKKQLENLQRLIQRDHITPRVVLTEGDHELPLDLTNQYCQKILLNSLKPSQSIVLREEVFQQDQLLIENEEGKFTNQFVIPLKVDKDKKPSSVFIPKPLSGKRTFPIGSAWLYFKIYCGVKTADALLTEEILPMTIQLQKEGIIEKWFFIRYADPYPHLRVRFQGKGLFYASVIQVVSQRLQRHLDTHLVENIVTDTYQRELERYGNGNIEDSETLFFYDSCITAEILSLLEGDEGDEVRWQLAMKGIDQLLDDFEYTLEEKYKLLTFLQKSFAEEFQATNKESKKNLSKRYREVRSKINTVLQPHHREEDSLQPAFDLFEKRSRVWKNTVHGILQKHQNSQLKISLHNLVSSYIHMFLNRFLRSKQRLHELLLYDFLAIYYRSQLARQKKK